MSEMYEKLKKRWGVENFWQVILILIIFSITGMTALYVKKIVFGLLEFDASTPFWIKAFTWFFTVLPSYQVLFLFYGFLFGQFDFVWRFEKKSLKRIKDLFGK